jgi:hypothetical protein
MSLKKKMMKMTFRVLWMFTAALTLSLSCKTENKPTQTIAVEGVLQDEEPGYVYIINSQDAQDYKNYYKAIDSVWVDSSGLFKFLLESDQANLYQIRNAAGFNAFYDKDLYLQPGDSLHIAQSEEGVDLKGNASELNQIQWKLNDQFYKDEQARIAYAQRRYLEPDEFEIYITELKENQIEAVNEFCNNILGPDYYRDYLLAKIHCHWIKDYWDYMQYHSYYAHDTWGYLPIDSLQHDILVEWKPDSTFNFIENYGYSIEGYVNYLHEENTVGMSDSLKWITSFNDKYMLITENLNGVNRDIALLMLSKEFWRYLTVLDKDFYSQAKVVNEYFANHKKSEKYFNLFSDNYNGFLKLSPGNTAPDFTLPDSTGKMISSSGTREALSVGSIFAKAPLLRAKSSIGVNPTQ